MEWLAADMPALARTVALQTRSTSLRAALRRSADQMEHRSVLGRLKAAGSAIAEACPSFDNQSFRALCNHRSDLVRQWACYAINADQVTLSMPERLRRTLPFAADRNMSVREAAWMAFRPHLQRQLHPTLRRLESVSARRDPNLRRFAVEVSRPRSVWGLHIAELKDNPQIAIVILDNVKADPSRYVQLAAGNWLNDAAKSRPDWVTQTCARWSRGASSCTQHILKRAMRNLARDVRIDSLATVPAPTAPGPVPATTL